MVRALPPVAVLMGGLGDHATMLAERSMQAELLPRRAGEGYRGSSWQATATSRSRSPSRPGRLDPRLARPASVHDGALPDRRTLPPDPPARV
jgi:hypothetical protein